MTRRTIVGAIALLTATVGCGVDRIIDSRAHEPLDGAPRPLHAAFGAPGDWSDPIEAGTPANPAIPGISPALSPDGLSLYFTSARAGGQGGFDIWVARRASVCDGFDSPMNLGATINTAAREQGAFVSADGHLLFFMRGNPLLTEGDIYVSRRTNVHDDFGWETPVLLGGGVNTAELETEPWFIRAGSDDEDAGLLYFGRGPNNTSQDFWVARVRTTGETISDAVPVTGLNSTGMAPLGNEDGIAVSKNGHEVVFASRRFETGFAELFSARRATVNSEWEPPELLAAVNSVRPEVHPALSDDGRTLVFSSARFGGSDFRIFMSRRAAPGGSACH